MRNLILLDLKSNVVEGYCQKKEPVLTRIESLIVGQLQRNVYKCSVNRIDYPDLKISQFDFVVAKHSCGSFLALITEVSSTGSKFSSHSMVHFL